MQKYLRCISNADNKFKICETSRCKKFWRFDDIGKSCLNLIIIQRSPALRSYTGVLSSTPFSLLTAQKKINLHTRVICLCQNVGKWHGSNRRCTYFRGFFPYILITLMRKIQCIKNCRFNILRCAMMSLLVYNHCYKGIDILNIWVIFLTVKLDSFIDR